MIRAFLFPLLWLLAPATTMAEDILPYQATETTFDNGLKVIVVPTGFPNLVSLQIPVKTGSRNEIEPGKTGFAHFFEHMMFRGTEKYPPEKYQTILTRAGARSNAYTTDDYTNYHITFAKEDLEKMLEIEADRFQNLSYPVAAFKTEARAVLGEYNKNVANPIRKLFEVQRDAAFTTHTYKHTTMGFIADIEDMPNQFEYSKVFFDRWYRPEYTTVMVVGDVDPEQTVELVRKYWGAWKRGKHTAEIPAEPAPQGPIYIHHEWSSPTAPLLAVAFHGPAFSLTETDAAAMDLLLQLTFGQTSDLYRRLVQDEQKVDFIAPLNAEDEDPSLINILARVKDASDVTLVRDAILAACAEARSTKVDPARLEEAKSFLRYSTAAGLDSSEAIASTLAGYVRFDREYQTFNRLFDLYAQVTPDDLLEAARTYFTNARLSVTTIAHGALDPSIATPPSVEHAAVTGGADDPGAGRLLVKKSESPQIVMKLMFLTGSADDPEGKEGLAELSAKMITQAGSDVLELAEIQKLLYPIAGRLGHQVDREMTVFTGAIHKDNLDRFSTIALDMLLNPGFRAEDFERNLSDQRNELRLDLIANNDEELGKEILQATIFDGTTYGHPTIGLSSALDEMTVADVKAFIRDHYTRANLVVAVSGDVPDAFLERLSERLDEELPRGQAGHHGDDAPEGRVANGLSIDVIEKDTRATAISFGHPIEVTRAHPDFVPLYLARTWLGEHRSSMSHLYQRIREIRGMNYGDYAYIEAFPNGGAQFFPDPNRARRAQIFEIWIRPVPPEQAVFAFKVALFELQNLIRDGLTAEDFDSTREYLMKNVFLLTDGQEMDLGYHLDGWWYHTGDYTAFMRERLRKLTVDDVNRAVRKHLSAERLHVVMITKDAEALRNELLADGFTKMTYGAEKPQDLLDEDEVIGDMKLGLRREDVRIVPVEAVFK